MIDIVTHNIIDMIESRDYLSVSNWLKTYKNLNVVSRDGSITYSNAITEAHPEAVQISDRFHLLKNLTDYSKEYLKTKLKQNIVIPVNSDIKIINELKAKPLKADKETFKTVREKTHEQKVLQKKLISNEVKELKKTGISKVEIARRTGLSINTVNNYLNKNFNPVYASYGMKKYGILNPYIDEINSLLDKKVVGKRIEEIIRLKGYNGSSSNFRYYVTSYNKQRKTIKSEERQKSKEVIKRAYLFKLLYKPLAKVKSISQKQFKDICKFYPCFKKIHKIVWQFKTILSDKKILELDKWLIDAEALKIDKINSFINGINRDIEAVQNAIIYDYSNGLAEGSVNKMKVIKRIMYGRCDFKTLRQKVLKLEELRHIN